MCLVHKHKLVDGRTISTSLIVQFVHLFVDLYVWCIIHRLGLSAGDLPTTYVDFMKPWSFVVPAIPAARDRTFPTPERRFRLAEFSKKLAHWRSSCMK